MLKHHERLSGAMDPPLQNYRERRIITQTSLIWILLFHGITFRLIDDATFEVTQSTSSSAYRITLYVTHGIQMILMTMVAGWILWRPRSSGRFVFEVLLPFVCVVTGVFAGNFFFSSDTLSNATTYTLELCCEPALGALFVLGFGAIRSFRFYDVQSPPETELRRHKPWSIGGLFAATIVLSIFIANIRWQSIEYEVSGWEFSAVNYTASSCCNAIAIAVMMIAVALAWSSHRVTVAAACILGGFAMHITVGHLASAYLGGSPDWLASTTGSMTAALILSSLGLLWRFNGYRIR